MIFGFIGTGHMGSALAAGVCRQAGPENVILANRTAYKAETLAKELGCRQGTNEEAASWADCLFLGVKPQQVSDLLASLKGTFARREVKPMLVSMAAGVTLAQLEDWAPDCPAVRIMPNTPAEVGEGVLLYALSPKSSQPELRPMRKALFEALGGCGKLIGIEEARMDAGSALSGCGPAFVDLFLEALADGGVACGLPRALALELAEQTVLGSAKLALAGGEHPGALKDAVCSPGGSTIQGVRALEGAGFRSAVMEAVIAAFEKTRTLGK